MRLNLGTVIPCSPLLLHYLGGPHSGVVGPLIRIFDFLKEFLDKENRGITRQRKEQKTKGTQNGLERVIHMQHGWNFLLFQGNHDWRAGTVVLCSTLLK